MPNTLTWIINWPQGNFGISFALLFITMTIWRIHKAGFLYWLTLVISSIWPQVKISAIPICFFFYESKSETLRMADSYGWELWKMQELMKLYYGRHLLLLIT